MFNDNQPDQPTQPVNEQPTASTEPQAPQQQPVAPEQPTAPEQPKKPAAPVAVPEKTTQEERMWAAIGYIAFLGIVSLAIKPKSEFCKHHAAQGLTIFILWFVSLIVLAIPITIVSGIGLILWLGFSGLAIFGIIKAIQSYKLEVPVLSSIAKKIPTNKIIGSVTGKVPEATKPAEGEDVAQEAPQAEQPAQPTQEAAPAESQEPQAQGEPQAEDKTPPATPPQA